MYLKWKKAIKTTISKTTIKTITSRTTSRISKTINRTIITIKSLISDLIPTVIGCVMIHTLKKEPGTKKLLHRVLFYLIKFSKKLFVTHSLPLNTRICEKSTFLPLISAKPSYHVILALYVLARSSAE